MWSNCRSKPQKEWNLFSLRDQSLCHHDPLLQYIYFNPSIVIHDWELGFGHYKELTLRPHTSKRNGKHCLRKGIDWRVRHSKGQQGLQQCPQSWMRSWLLDLLAPSPLCPPTRTPLHRSLNLYLTNQTNFTSHHLLVPHSNPFHEANGFILPESRRRQCRTNPTSWYKRCYEESHGFLYMAFNGSPFESSALVSKHIHHCTDRWNRYLRNQTNFTRYDIEFQCSSRSKWFHSSRVSEESTEQTLLVV